LGAWQETIGLPWEYFAIRGCFLDCRSPLVISPKSAWGIKVQILTESHDISRGPGTLGIVVPRPVYVEDGAWIGSYSLLIGCRIGAGAIVAAGTVVRCQDVGPGVMVAGNPAQVIARWDGAAWVYAGFDRMLV
jgi:acetyltransferase-like isoleucine patch superfamily enzyme